MANFVDENELQEGSVEEEISQVTEQTQEPQVQETPAQEPEELPEKYKGKSASEIVKMHQEAEKMIGRQAQEVHEVRSLADQLLKQQLESNKTKQTTEQTQDEDDFFADPQKAVNRTVDQHPAVLEAKKASLEFKKMQTTQQLVNKHPDFMEVVQNTNFHDWVKASPIRLDLLNKAEIEFDYNAANELLSTYKELQHAKAIQQTNQMKSVETKAQDTALKAASVDVGGSGEISRKVYRRADLIKLKMTDPDRYMALQDEIMSAYADGRVK